MVCLRRRTALLFVKSCYKAEHLMGRIHPHTDGIQRRELSAQVHRHAEKHFTDREFFSRF